MAAQNRNAAFIDPMLIQSVKAKGLEGQVRSVKRARRQIDTVPPSGNTYFLRCSSGL